MPPTLPSTSASCEENKLVIDNESLSSSLKRKSPPLNHDKSNGGSAQEQENPSSSSFAMIQIINSSSEAVAQNSDTIKEVEQREQATTTTMARPLKRVKQDRMLNDNVESHITTTCNTITTNDPVTVLTGVTSTRANNTVVAEATADISTRTTTKERNNEGPENEESRQIPNNINDEEQKSFLQMITPMPKGEHQEQKVQPEGHDETSNLSNNSNQLVSSHHQQEQQQQQPTLQESTLIATSNDAPASVVVEQEHQNAIHTTSTTLTNIPSNSNEIAAIASPSLLQTSETTDPSSYVAVASASDTQNLQSSTIQEASSGLVSTVARTDYEDTSAFPLYPTALTTVATSAATDQTYHTDHPIVTTTGTTTTTTPATAGLPNTTKNDNHNNKIKPTRLSWEDRLAQLVQYKVENGDCLVPTRYKRNPSLGKWVHNQREQYKLYHKKTKPGYKKKCSMTQERITKLENAGFVWSTERSKKAHEEWMVRFQQLCKYKEIHGNTMVPHGYKADPSLAEWVHRQRTTYALHEKQSQQENGGNSTCSNSKVQERMAKLESIGFAFCVQDDNWKERWEQLLAYKEQRGHCQVPTHYTENKALGRWVHTQRHQYRLFLKNKKSCMTQERIDQLNQLGFNWEVRPALEQPRVTWQSRFEELKSFHEREGHFDVTQEHNASLHRWVQEQKQRLRQLQKHGQDITKRMGPDRVAALENIGFCKGYEV